MHGYRRQSSGCKALLGGTAIQKHSDLCRKRMAEALVGQRRVEEARERKRRFMEEALEEEGKIWESKEMLKKAKRGEVNDEKVTNVAEGVKRDIENKTQEESATKKLKPETASAEVEELMEIGKIVVNQEDEFDFGEWAVDDITGGELDLVAVKDARREELDFKGPRGVRGFIVGRVRAEDRQGSNHDEMDRHGQGGGRRGDGEVEVSRA